MPALLRYDSIRLFESSLEALHLAVSALGTVKRIDFRQAAAKYAVEIGLIGTAAEQAMSACLIHARGLEAIVWPSGQYKTASAVLDDFKELVSQPTAASSFLTDGVGDPPAHRTALLSALRSLKFLFLARANGFHAGSGLSHEASVIKANDVADFLELLAQSRRIAPYMTNIPRCLWYSRDRAIVIEELQRLIESSSGSDRISALASIYLIIPDIPEEEPDRLTSLERAAVKRHDRDVTFLIDNLEHALPAALRRAGDARQPIPVRVNPEDPRALPIEPQFLRRQFNRLPELWHADIATANGRLEQGAIDLPPVEAVIDVLGIGFERAGIIQGGEHLSGHEAWPHVLASLDVQGTPGPYWFIVRRCNDLGQLSAQLRRAAAHRNRLRNRLPECMQGIEVFQAQEYLRCDDPIFHPLIEDIVESQEKRERLIERERHHRNGPRILPELLRALLASVAEGGEAVGRILQAVLDSDQITPQGLTY